MRIIGDNSAGFSNEREIRDALNAHLYNNINPNLRHFLDDVFKGYSLQGKWVHAHTIPQRMKPDFYVTIDGIPNGAYISVKMGTGNSLHQESLETFIDFYAQLGAPQSILDSLKKYHWSDGTIDNSGETRYTSKTFAKMFPSLVNDVNNFLNRLEILRATVKRCLFKGNYPDAPEADYIYHGSVRNGVWASKKEIFKYIETYSVGKNCVSIGPLTYQAWNKNLDRNPSSEYKRLQMQLKWGDLEDALIDITSRRDDFVRLGTYDGDLSEKASVITFNRNPSSLIFKDYLKLINKKYENVLLIRVTTKQFSKLSNQKVYTRADAYAIEIVDSRIYDILEFNNYYLDEDILSEYGKYYTLIENSGISIKRDNSDNYTLIKLTPNSFHELFGNYELGYGASIFCKNSSELYLNIKLLQGWNTTIEDLQEYFGSNKITEYSLTNSLDICKNIKEVSIDRIVSSIDSSLRLQSIIFNGKHIYEEPYTACFFMQNNIIKTLNYIPFSVTTGSGRSHGDYSIVLKPKNPPLL